MKPPAAATPAALWALASAFLSYVLSFIYVTLFWNNRHCFFALTFGVGQVLLIVVQPLWARMLIAFVFVAPAALAGYHAIHGVVRHTMPSEARQTVFSIIGAVAVGATAFMRVAGMAAAVPPGQRLAPGMATPPPSEGPEIAMYAPDSPSAGWRRGDGRRIESTPGRHPMRSARHCG